MQFSFLKVALISVVVSMVNAGIIAFSGNTCNGDEGLNVPCDGGCIGFVSRHSYRVLATGNHCVTYFENADCTVNIGNNVNSGNGACTNVNTGTDMQSIRCSPNNVCQILHNSTDGTAASPASNLTASFKSIT